MKIVYLLLFKGSLSFGFSKMLFARQYFMKLMPGYKGLADMIHSNKKILRANRKRKY